MSGLSIGARAIGPGAPPFLIAEIGVNHDGDAARALELVHAAAAAGADAIKLQYFRAGLLVGRTARPAAYQARAGARDAHDLLARLELADDAFAATCAAVRGHGLAPIVTVFCVELVDEAATWDVDAFKTASPDIVHRPLLEALAEKASPSRPLLVSTGAATATEVRAASTWLASCPYLFLQCVSAYPTPEPDAALAGLRGLDGVKDRGWGYSDHTAAVDTGGLAVAAGACVLEKHFTLDRSAPGPDHSASLDPIGFAEYARLARRAWTMLGPSDKRVLDVERDVRTASRQSLTAGRDLSAGHRLAAEDLVVRRPGTGLGPAELARVIGRALDLDLRAGTPLLEEHLAPAPRVKQLERAR